MNKEEFIKEYNELTEDNLHGEAVELACNFLNYPLLAEKMKHINALHELYGSLTKPIEQLRTDVEKDIRIELHMILNNSTKDEAITFYKELDEFVKQINKN